MCKPGEICREGREAYDRLKADFGCSTFYEQYKPAPVPCFDIVASLRAGIRDVPEWTSATEPDPAQLAELKERVRQAEEDNSKLERDIDRVKLLEAGVIPTTGEAVQGKLLDLPEELLINIIERSDPLAILLVAQTCRLSAKMAYRALLRPTALITETISTSVVHPAYFPYPLPLVLHAVRISHAYSSKVKASGHKLPPFQHLAGFLVMAWGGGLWTNALLCLPPVQLYSVTPWIIYCSVHLAMTTLFGSILPSVSSNRISWPSGRVMDTMYPPLDAICRSTPIIAAISAAKNHSNVQVRESLLAQLILGAVASMGGGAAAGFFGVWDKEWSLKTPAFLKGGLLPTMDLWAGAIAAAIYGIATLSHPAYEPINEFLVGKPKAFMTPLGAKATVVLYLTSMYVIRVALTHYLPANAPASSRGKKLGAATPTSSGQRVAVKPVSKEKKAQ